MRLKPPPKLRLEQVADTLHQSIDGVADALKTLPTAVRPPKVIGSEQAEKQALLAYFARLMDDFFEAAKSWRQMPLDEAKQAYGSYMQGLLPELPPKLKARFTQRAEAYAQALFGMMTEAEIAQQSQQFRQAFVALVQDLEEATLAALELDDEAQAQVISLAYGDYHQALVAGVQAGFITQETAEFMADDLKQQLLLAATASAVRRSKTPLLVALEIADGTTGEPEIDALPKPIRRTFLETLIGAKEVNHDTAQ